ncbi:MBL fold hydrolase [Trichlorobacter lovleyi]|uniref:MBL fold metallo-hydrolase n=1 Tax=Trichlorobacter lovleyi TaxID=313985 RepID=UPI002240B296|nr:MBL fold hydrolase [Trichlorobacter lovleyi]QOX79991.1 MBL fold hydrolase [Trichlorobacter lovleyi]
MGSHSSLDEAIEISAGIYWVGAGTKTFLSRNSFLRVYEGNKTTGTLLIDPGPTSDFVSLSHKVSSILPGGLASINLAFINHQDPDVVGVLPKLYAMNRKLNIIATEDTWRLVSLNGLASVRFRSIDQVQEQRLVLPTGHRLQFIPTPYCHFRGASMIYDLESRILFTGDFLGGVEASGLIATQENWAGIKAFHQLYMPSNEAIKLAVKKIRALEPAPLTLAPQHGGLIRGDLIELVLERISELPVGLDIVTSFNDRLPALITGLNDVLVAVKETMGEYKVDRILRDFKPEGEYPSLITLGRDGLVKDIKGDPFEAINALLNSFMDSATEKQQKLLRPMFNLLML